MRKCTTLIIGSGESGLEAAEFLAENQQHVIICEQDELGGSYTTLHDLVLKDALTFGKTFHSHLSRFKSYPETYKVLLKERAGLIDLLRHQEKTRLAELKSEYIKNPYLEFLPGHARLISPSLAEVKTKEGRELVSFDYCICATGKQDIQIPYIEGSDSPRVWNEYTLFNNNELPTSVALIGCTEDMLTYAFMYAYLGIKVHVFESKKPDHCLPSFDKTVFNVILKKLLMNHVEFHFETNVDAISQSKKGHTIHFKNDTVQVSDVVIAAKKVFTDTINATETGLKFTPNGLVTNTDGKIYGSEKMYAVGEANDRFELGKNKEILHNCLTALIADFKKQKVANSGQFNTMAVLHTLSASDSMRFTSHYPRMIGLFEGITIGVTEHEARNLYGSLARSEAYETPHNDVIKTVYNAQTDKLLGIALSGSISKEALLFSLYCIDTKKKQTEFGAYIRGFLNLF